MHNVLEITDTIIDYKLFFTLVKRLPPALLFYLAKRCIVVVKAEYRTYFFPIGCRHPHHFMTFVCSFFWEKKENSHVWSQGCLLFSIGPWLCDFLFCLLSFFWHFRKEQLRWWWPLPAGISNAAENWSNRGLTLLCAERYVCIHWHRNILLDVLFNPSIFFVTRDFQQTGAGSLFLAAQGGFRDIVNLLIRAGAPVNARCKVNMSLEKVAIAEIS